MDNSARKTAPTREIEVRKNHEGEGYLLVAVERRPEAGKKETLLRIGAITEYSTALDIAEGISRSVEAITGAIYSYPGSQGNLFDAELEGL